MIIITGKWILVEDYGVKTGLEGGIPLVRPRLFSQLWMELHVD